MSRVILVSMISELHVFQLYSTVRSCLAIVSVSLAPMIERIVPAWFISLLESEAMLKNNGKQIFVEDYLEASTEEWVPERTP